MKRWQIISLTALGSAVLLLLAAPFVIDGVAAGIAKREFSDKFSSQLEIGSVSTSWFRGQVIKDLCLVSGTDKPIEIKEIVVDRTLGGLVLASMGNEFRAASSVQIKGVRGTLLVREDGSNTLDAILTALTPKKESATESAKIERFPLIDRLIDAAPQIAISDLRLQVLDQFSHNDLDCQFSSVKLSCQGDKTKAQLALDIEGQVLSQAEPAPVSLQLTLDAPLTRFRALVKGEAPADCQLFDLLPEASLKLRLADVSTSNFSSLASLHYVVFAEAQLRSLREANNEFLLILDAYKKNQDVSRIIDVLSSYNVKGGLINSFRKVTGLVTPLCKVSAGDLSKASQGDRKAAARVAGAFEQFQKELAAFIETIPSQARLAAQISSGGFLSTCPDLCGGLNLDVALNTKGLHLNECSASILLPQKDKKGNFLYQDFAKDSRRIECGLRHVVWGFGSHPTILGTTLQKEGGSHNILDLTNSLLDLVPTELGGDIFCTLDSAFLRSMALSKNLHERLETWGESSEVLDFLASSVLPTKEGLDDYESILKNIFIVPGPTEISGGVSCTDTSLEGRFKLISPQLTLDDAFFKAEIVGSKPSQRAKTEPLLCYLDTTELTAGSGLVGSSVLRAEPFFEIVLAAKPLLLGIVDKLQKMTLVDAFVGKQLPLTAGARKVVVQEEVLGGSWYFAVNPVKESKASTDSSDLSLILRAKPDGLVLQGSCGRSTFSWKKILAASEEDARAHLEQIQKTPVAWLFYNPAEDANTQSLSDDIALATLDQIMLYYKAEAGTVQAALKAPDFSCADLFSSSKLLQKVLSDVSVHSYGADYTADLARLPRLDLTAELEQVTGQSGFAMLNLSRGDVEKVSFGAGAPDVLALLQRQSSEGNCWTSCELAGQKAGGILSDMAQLGVNFLVRMVGDRNGDAMTNMFALQSLTKTEVPLWLEAFGSDFILALDLVGPQQKVKVESPAIRGDLVLESDGGPIGISGHLEGQLGPGLSALAKAKSLPEPLGLLDAFESANKQLSTLQESLKTEARLSLLSYLFLPFNVSFTWAPLKSVDPAADQLPFAIDCAGSRVTMGGKTYEWGPSLTYSDELLLQTALKCLCLPGYGLSDAN